MVIGALNRVIAAVEEEAERIRQEFYRPDGPRGRRGHCAADKEIEERLRSKLQAILPGQFAGEETGMSAALQARCDRRVGIPGSGAVESLNVSAAFAVFAALWAAQSRS